MNLNQTITPSPEVISQEVSGETVLLGEISGLRLIRLEQRA